MTVPPAAEGRSLVVKRWTHHPRCVPEARHELRGHLGAWGMPTLADAAEVVLSELLTNSLRHARSPQGRLIETRYERLDGGVQIEVHDANESWPVLQEPSADAECGRGLALVDAITGARWGVSAREGVGKRVWAVVAQDDADAEGEVPGR
nr:ATP-binding protein [Streptomyces sp. CBMA29]